MMPPPAGIGGGKPKPPSTMKSVIGLFPALVAALGLSPGTGLQIPTVASANTSAIYFPGAGYGRHSRRTGPPPASWFVHSQRKRRKAARRAHAAGDRLAFKS